MYFKSRETAGRLLAGQVAKRYANTPVAVVALSDGGVVVGMQIALKLRAVLMMLMSDTIDLPRETQALAGITSDGAFSYNHAYSQGEIDELVSEYHNFIDQQKMQRLHDMRRSIGRADLLRRDLLQDKVIILVSDGLFDGFTLDLAFEFLKPIRSKKVIIATPLASVQAVDRMHILSDGIFCLNVLEDYMETNHYYTLHDLPPHERVVDTVEKILAQWK